MARSKAADATPSTARSSVSPETPDDPNPLVKDSGHDKQSSKNDGRLEKLQYLLKQSGIYSQIIGDKMDRDRAERRAAAAKAQKKESKGSIKPSAPPAESAASTRNTRHGATKAPVTTTKANKATTAKRKAAKDEDSDGDAIMEEALTTAAATTSAKKKRKRVDEDDDEGGHEHRQPALVTGAELRDYQVAGVEWLITLYENGLNGILADEMGLGKTLQTISFLAHLREKGVWGPFLIVCPLSTLANWVNEFERFTPTIPVIMYHGSPDDRADLRTTRLNLPGYIKNGKTNKKPRYSAPPKGSKNPAEDFPIVVTTYELVMNDRAYLNRLQWKYIVVDESHRLKNLNCKLIQELKTYTSANRLLLTGTPLHNNLAELWSLLNFCLPDIFDNLDSFQQWFDFSDLDTAEGENRVLTEEQSNHVLSNLHAILKPFLLRRIKADVESSLPPKKEYLLSAPLTAQQKELYDAVVNKTVRSFLIGRKTAREDGGYSTANSTAPSTPIPTDTAASSDVETQSGSISGRTRRKGGRGRRDYEEKSDEQFFDDLDNDSTAPATENDDDSMSMAEMGRAHRQKQVAKSVNSLKLQNLVMQLRKVCNHPWLFDWPVDADTGANIVNEDLINASGKMLMLNRLLTELFARGHKVLVFSQFTSQLDLIQDWAEEYKGWKIARIDGHTKQDDRRTQMKSFNEDKGEDAINLFLLSTRSGGVGINLVAADTVILFDSDWNPQMDLQAQDRVHRIGQTKPVLVFRLISANTVESTILQRAGAKRKLEALVIGQGTFSKAPSATSADDMAEILSGKTKRKGANMAELAEVLLRNEGEEIQLVGKDDELLSDEQLEALLDRSPEAMSRDAGFKTGAAEVFETQVGDEAGDALARMLRESAAEVEG